jgi:hypothetical protein
MAQTTKICYNQRMKKESNKGKASGKVPVIKFRQSLFWDVDPKTIDPQKHARYIIERIIEFGDDKEVRWMWNTYPHILIYDIAATKRGLMPRTRPLWKALTTTT